jgi:choline dehydrogenase-like flavoprotein
MADVTNSSVEADVVVVGSGAAGSIMAARCAAAGKKVLILEAGPERSNADLVSSTLWARRLKWYGPTVRESGANPVGSVFNSGYGLGGSAMHHYAVWPRLHVDDFRMRSRFDQGLDWPIAYDDLRAYYDDVQTEVGISGDAKQETWRPQGAEYPMPPVPVFAQGRVIARGFEKLGMRTAPLPLAVTSQVYKGRAACIWDGWCDAGCPIGALANPLTYYLPLAQSKGTEIRCNATVTRVLMNEKGTAATGVEYRDQTGAAVTVRATLVVLAAFAVQTPRLLLASQSAQHPNGLGNARDQVGRYMMTHPAGLIFGLFDEPTEPSMGAYGGQLLNQDGYDKRTHAKSGAFGSYQWMIAQASKPNDLLGITTTRPDLIGADLEAFLKRSAKGFATMTAVVEDLPVANNRVTLSAERDAHGVPLAAVEHTTHAASRQLWQETLSEGKRVFEAAGAKEVWTGPQGAMHLMGGTIMGKDPRTSVTNSYGQLHDVPNVVVAGPGLFPTSGGVNPTFTVHALAARSSEHLLREWRSLT